MCYVILIISLLQMPSESPIPEQVVVKKNYTKNVIINGGIGLGLGLGAYYCKSTADKAYDAYKSASTMKKTVEQWNKVVLYDRLTIFLGAGSAVFFARAVYYQIKNVKQTKIGRLMPDLDFRYAENNKIILGFEKKL